MDGFPDFDIRFEVRGDVLLASVSGQRDSLAVSKRFWKQVHDRAIESGCTRVLVEENFPNQLSTMEMFKVAEYVAETFRGFTKVAHVDLRSSDMELNSFGEDVAVNRRLRVRVFNTRADAESWLADSD